MSIKNLNNDFEMILKHAEKNRDEEKPYHTLVDSLQRVVDMILREMNDNPKDNYYYTLIGEDERGRPIYENKKHDLLNGYLKSIQNEIKQLNEIKNSKLNECHYRNYHKYLSAYEKLSRIERKLKYLI